MEKLQTDINPSMRGILVDWLVEVSPVVAALCRFVYLSTYDEFYLLPFSPNVIELYLKFIIMLLKYTDSNFPIPLFRFLRNTDWFQTLFT